MRISRAKTRRMLEQQWVWRRVCVLAGKPGEHIITARRGWKYRLEDGSMNEVGIRAQQTGSTYHVHVIILRLQLKGYNLTELMLRMYLMNGMSTSGMVSTPDSEGTHLYGDVDDLPRTQCVPFLWL